MPKLVVISGLNAGRSFALSARETLIGRDSACEIPLSGHTVSRRHARVIRDDGKWLIEDLQSVNGTWLNGARIEKRTPLADQDQIGIYDTVMMFSDGSDTVAAKVSDLRAKAENETPSSTNIVSSLELGDEHQPTVGNAEDKLNAILEITRSLSGQLNRETLLARSLEALFRIFPHTDRGYILQEVPGGGLHPVAIQQEGDSDTINPAGGEIANRVMSEGAAFLSSDTVNDKRIQELSESIFEEGIRSVMCAPLVGPSRSPLGVIHLETSNPHVPFTQDDLAVLAAVGVMAGQVLEYSRLHKDLVELERQRSAMHMAHEVQMQSLQEKPPVVPGYEFFHQYDAADSVAGDYYEYVPLSDGRLAIVIGDVAGKGVSAALLVARLLSEVRYALQTNKSLVDAVSSLNRLLFERKFSVFVTALVMVLDPRENTLTLVNAGHMDPFHRLAGSGEVRELTIEQQGLPLVVRRESNYTETTVRLEPGDVVLAFTDGVTDAQNAAGEVFGLENTRKVAIESDNQARHMGRALSSAIRTFKAGHAASDDVCIVCIARN